MTDISFESFLPEVLPYVHDCPQLVALNAIRNACMEFCEKSDYWLYEHDPISIAANVATYEFDVPSNAQVANILDMWCLNLPMYGKSQDDLKMLFQYDWRSVEGRPQYYTQLNPDEFVIAPKSTVAATSALKLIVALKPTRTATTVDINVYENWAEAIGMGAKARLYDTPGQPFSDPAQAMKFRKWFESAIGEAKIDRNRGLTRGPLVARPNPFI